MTAEHFDEMQALATFLYRLQTLYLGELWHASSLHDMAHRPITNLNTLQALVREPDDGFAPLLHAHVQHLLAIMPGGAAMQPSTLPATLLWVAAILNNIVWATSQQSISQTTSDDKLLHSTQHLVATLPPAHTLENALAYHSLLRFLEHISPPQSWDSVVEKLLQRSPLTAFLLPRHIEPFPCEHVHAIFWYNSMRCHTSLFLFSRDRMNSLLPFGAKAYDVSFAPITAAQAYANAAIGTLLSEMLDYQREAWLPFVLEVYEADCFLLRQGSPEQPQWHLLNRLHTMGISHNARLRQRARLMLKRYAPLETIWHDAALLRSYRLLDGRFIEQIRALRKSL